MERSPRGGGRAGGGGGANISREVTTASIFPSARRGGWGTGSAFHEGRVQGALGVGGPGPVDHGAEAEGGRGHLERLDPGGLQRREEADQRLRRGGEAVADDAGHGHALGEIEVGDGG